MIELAEPRPPAPPEALAQTERRLGELGRSLPPSYRAFLAEQDGGRPVRNTFTFDQGGSEQSSRVAAFLGVQPAPGGDLVDTAELVGDVPEDMLAIAEDEFGNLICLRAGDGAIVFWDHEEEFGNVYEVAPDLQAFLDGLSAPQPPADPEPAPERTGWRRLFGR